jgi:hypothetical protein
MNPKAIIDSLTGIGDRSAEATPDDIVRACAALLYLHGQAYYRGVDGVLSRSIYGSSAIIEAAEAIGRLTAQEVVDRLRDAVEADNHDQR